MMPDCKIGLDVRTPSGRIARVTGYINGRVRLRFVDDGEEVVLDAALLRVVFPASGPRR